MFIKSKIIIGIGVILAVIGIVSMLGVDVPKGSVSVSSEYRKTNLTSLTASGTAATLLKGGTSVLGSVVFATTSAQTFTFYDVAAGANYASTTLSTKIVEFATGTPAGTYTFDVQNNRGLAVYSPVTSTAEIVVTYR